ncbi:uncharacterized protein FFMR_01857 [Fusarium fujikuroi]|nr:uncharacterized protein FFMR_01857 [Fusarium fujikuroi]
MRRFFGRKEEPRRNSDDDHKKMQYYSPRGIIPIKVVEQQTQEVVFDPTQVSRNTKDYPHAYEDVNLEGKTFQEWERRHDEEKVRLYEMPVNTRMNLEKRPATFKQVQRHELEIRPNDRKDAVRKELNDPGVFRGVITGNVETGQVYGVQGVIYHPEQNPRGFRRSPIEPLDREGRQFLRRFEDDAADPNRVTTWPPRDEDASDLQAYEDRYKQVRKTRPPQQQKSKQKAPNAN